MINKITALMYLMGMKNSNDRNCQYVKKCIDEGKKVSENRKNFLKMERKRINQLIEFISTLPNDDEDIEFGNEDNDLPF